MKRKVVKAVRIAGSEKSHVDRVLFESGNKIMTVRDLHGITYGRPKDICTKVKEGERSVVEAMQKVSPFSMPTDPEVEALKGRVNKLVLEHYELRAIVKQYFLGKKDGEGDT